MHLSPVYPWFTSHLQRITHFGQLPLKTLIYLECSSILSWHQKCQHLFSGCFPLGLNLKKHVAMGQNSESQKGRFNHVHYGWRCWRQTNVGQKLSSPKAQQRKFDPYIIYIYISLELGTLRHNCQLPIGTPILTHGHVRSHLGQFGAECGLVHRRGSRQGARFSRGALVEPQVQPCGKMMVPLSVCYVTWWPYGNYINIWYCMVTIC